MFWDKERKLAEGYSLKLLFLLFCGLCAFQLGFAQGNIERDVVLVEFSDGELYKFAFPEGLSPLQKSYYWWPSEKVSWREDSLILDLQLTFEDLMKEGAFRSDASANGSSVRFYSNTELIASDSDLPFLFRVGLRDEEYVFGVLAGWVRNQETGKVEFIRGKFWVKLRTTVFAE